MTDLVNLFASVGGIAAQIIALILIVGFVFRKKDSEIFVFFSRHGIALAFLLGLVAMLTSLYYSEIALFVPCVLCWYQRIFMYPLVFMLGLALVRRDKAVIPYAMILSIIGALIGAFHLSIYYLQSDVACSAAGGASCIENYFTLFGYMNIPMLSFSAFVLVTLLLAAARGDSGKTA